jgi:hypothetical protein
MHKSGVELRISERVVSFFSQLDVLTDRVLISQDMVCMLGLMNILYIQWNPVTADNNLWSKSISD